jgi:hypothetical protein
MLVTYLLSAAAAAVVYSFSSTVATRRRHAAIAKQLSCEPAPIEYRADPFALINLFKLMWAHNNNRVLEYLRGTFDDTSLRVSRTVYTYETKILGDKVIWTCDPRNIQAMLATQFKDFELGQIRTGSFAPL